MIHRVIKNKDNPYVIMNKSFLENPNLSLKAKGLLSYLLSKPDNWKIITEDLVKKSTNGRESVSSAIRELIDIGYIHRIQTREDNKFGPYEYHIYEQPKKPDEPADGKPADGKPESRFSETNNNDSINNNRVSTDSFSFLKDKKEKESEANQGFAPINVNNSSKVVLNLRKKPNIAEPIQATTSKADDIRNKKTTLAKPPPDPINVPSTIQEYLDIWTKAGFKLPSPNTKSFAKVVMCFKQLKRGNFFKDKPKYQSIENKVPLSIEHWELIVERYKKALSPEYRPADKSWLQKLNILSFLWDPYGNTCSLMDFSAREPELRIQNVYPDITKSLITAYSEEILNNPTYAPPIKDMERFILAGNRAGEFFKQNGKKIPVHFNLTTFKKAQLVVRAVKKAEAGETDVITPGYLCSDTTFNIRLPKYLTDQAMFVK